MYNRYLTAHPCQPEPVACAPEPLCADEKKPAEGGLLQALTGRLGEIKIDSDTLIALAVIWFLLSDGELVDTDLLIIIGVLLILGV